MIYIKHPSPVRIIMPAPAIENVSPLVERDTSDRRRSGVATQEIVAVAGLCDGENGAIL